MLLSVYDVNLYYKTELITEIHVKGTEVTFENHSDLDFLTAFGVRTKVTYADLLEFYEARCFPRERVNARGLIKALGLDYYDPEMICRKTHGMQFDDFLWLQFSDEPQVKYDDIKLRD